MAAAFSAFASAMYAAATCCHSASCNLKFATPQPGGHPTTAVHGNRYHAAHLLKGKEGILWECAVDVPADHLRRGAHKQLLHSNANKPTAASKFLSCTAS